MIHVVQHAARPLERPGLERQHPAKPAHLPRGKLPLGVTQQVYDAFIEELIDLVSKGNKVTLTGFGKFYPQEHKGHRVRFADGDGSTEIDDYTVLKQFEGKSSLPTYLTVIARRICIHELNRRAAVRESIR